MPNASQSDAVVTPRPPATASHTYAPSYAPEPRPAGGLGSGAESALGWLAAYPVFPLQVLLFMLIAFGGLGAELGAERLFWHEFESYQLGVGFFVGLLVAVVFFVEFLVNRPDRVVRWLDKQLGFTVFPSADGTVKSLGRYLFCGMLSVGLAFLVVKAVTAAFVEPEVTEFVGEQAAGDKATFERTTGRVGYLASRSWLWPFAAGYVLSMVFAWALYLIDEGPIRSGVYGKGVRSLRDWVLGTPAEPRWLRRRLARRAVPPDDYPLYAIGLYATVVAAAVAVGLVVLSWWLDRNRPGEAMCTPVSLVAAVLILFNLVYWVLVFYFRAQRLVIAGVVFALMVWNSTCVFHENNYKVRFPHLGEDGRRTVLWDAALKDEQDRYRNRVLKASQKYAAANLIPSTDPIEAMHARWPGAPAKKPKLILIATSGGGIRAAVWTAVVLNGLEADPGLATADFRGHIRMITGASGGMVAAALYAADFEPGRPVSYVDVLAADSLNRTAQSLVLRDMTRNAVLPPWASAGWDRGRTLEWKWGLNAGGTEKEPRLGRNPFAKTFAELRGERGKPGKEAGEWGGWRPSLVISPMMVEDSRRLLISNLDLKDLTIETQGGDGPRFVSAVEFHRLFPDLPPGQVKAPDGTDWPYATSQGFQVGTAARMSATFPVISPAVSLPTVPPRRVVDAGYYDNYGMNLAALWIHRHRDDLKKHTSGVALIEIRAFPLHQAGRRFAATDPQTGRPVASAGSGDLFTDAAAAVSAPLEAIFNARGNITYFRNSEWVDILSESLKADGLNFYNGWFELTRPAALNWYLTGTERTAIETEFRSKAVQEKLADLRQWYGTGGE